MDELRVLSDDRYVRHPAFAAYSERNRKLLEQWAAGVPTEDSAREARISLARVKVLAARACIPRPAGYKRPRALSVPDAEFWNWVDRRGPGECWPWLGSCGPQGYGAGLPHRRAYKMLVGPIPLGKMLLHSCDNPPCCNPAHLRPGSAFDNSMDMRSRGRGPWQR